MYKKYADLRDKAGLTDYAVSKKTGVPTSTLTNWKYGRYTPKLDKISLLANLFDVSVEYFLNITSEQNKKGGE